LLRCSPEPWCHPSQASSKMILSYRLWSLISALVDPVLSRRRLPGVFGSWFVFPVLAQCLYDEYVLFIKAVDLIKGCVGSVSVAWFLDVRALGWGQSEFTVVRVDPDQSGGNEVGVGGSRGVPFHDRGFSLGRCPVACGPRDCSI
jgi:hypothetical protein